jgi:hypothetical protein
MGKDFTVNKWRIKEDFSSAEDEENEIKENVEKIESKNAGYIRGELMVDPISKKYFSSKLYEDERR